MAKDKVIEAAGFYGSMLFYGAGCKADKKLAVLYLKKAAVLHKEPLSCYLYAEILLDEESGYTDKEEGMKYLRIASEAGIQDAAELLEMIKSSENK